jgi:hypothetical protein
MKKIALLFFFILKLYTASAQKSANFIYVDFSSTKKLSKLSEKVNVVAKDFNDPFVLFLSNDNAPVIIRGNEGIDNGLGQMFSLRPSSPDFVADIDTINAIFSNSNIINGLNNTSTASNYQVKLFFFLSAEKFEQNYLNKNLIDRLLLTNRLVSKDGLKDGVHVTIFLDGDFDPSGDFYADLMKNRKFKVQSY